MGRVVGRRRGVLLIKSLERAPPPGLRCQYEPDGWVKAARATLENVKSGLTDFLTNTAVGCGQKGFVLIRDQFLYKINDDLVICLARHLPTSIVSEQSSMPRGMSISQ